MQIATIGKYVLWSGFNKAAVSFIPLIRGMRGASILLILLREQYKQYSNV